MSKLSQKELKTTKIDRPKPTPKPTLFKIKKANEWLDLAKSTPTPKMLFSELWHEGELCILFAGSNLGKSILSVQIANSISKGEPIEGFKFEAEKQEVLYFDFELSPKQFEIRYSELDKQAKKHTNHFNFDVFFNRVEIDPDAEIIENISFEEYLRQSIGEAIKQTGAKILIIDNITYLKNETEKSSQALSLMKELKALKTKYNLSILALAHTPKRDLTKPITGNDLSGSAMLLNFVDSCFTVGLSSKDKSLRYIKQIKARNTEIVYDTENVILAQIEKDTNFLNFNFIGFDNEKDHLKEINEKDKTELKQTILSLKRQGKSLREIGRTVGLSHTRVDKIIKECKQV